MHGQISRTTAMFYILCCAQYFMILKLKDIQRQPTTLEKVHESCYRSYHILEQVLQMVERGDSKETIFEVVEMLREYPLDTEFTKPERGD